jgi:hypothetical protein
MYLDSQTVGLELRFLKIRILNYLFCHLTLRIKDFTVVSYTQYQQH